MSGAAWITSYILLWAAVIALGLTVLVLLRHIGVLHARLGPQGVHHAGEGPATDAPAPPVGWFEYDAAPLTLVAFTAPGCELCAALRPSLVRLVRDDDDLAVEFVEHAPDTTGVFRAWNVSQTPYVVAVDRDGVVRGGGVANSLEQVEVLVDAVRGQRRDVA